jgi:hypothetical protein
MVLWITRWNERQKTDKIASMAFSCHVTCTTFRCNTLSAEAKHEILSITHKSYLTIAQISSPVSPLLLSLLFNCITVEKLLLKHLSTLNLPNIISKSCNVADYKLISYIIQGDSLQAEPKHGLCHARKLWTSKFSPVSCSHSKTMEIQPSEDTKKWHFKLHAFFLLSPCVDWLHRIYF